MPLVLFCCFFSALPCLRVHESEFGGGGGDCARGELRGEITSKIFAAKTGGESFPWRNFGVTVPSFTTAAGIVFPEKGQA